MLLIFALTHYMKMSSNAQGWTLLKQNPGCATASRQYKLRNRLGVVPAASPTEGSCFMIHSRLYSPVSFSAQSVDC